MESQSKEDREQRRSKFDQLSKARKKMETACQNGSRKGQRRAAKRILELQAELGLSSEKWMVDAFGKK